jgi:hypothetical protein
MRIAALAVAAGLPGAALCAGQTTSVSIGAEYSRGTYGASQPTRIAYFPLTLARDADSHALALTVPYLIVSGPGTVVASGGAAGVPRGRGGARAVSETEHGIGDVLLRGSVNLGRQTARRARLDLTGKVKLGTADRERNLGTGENDYALQLDLEHGTGSDAVFGSLGGKIVGDPPGVDYRNVVYASAGTSLGLRGTASVSLILDAQTPLLDGVPGQRTLTLIYSDRTDRRTRVSPYLLRGLSESSPDWGVGVTFKFIR